MVIMTVWRVGGKIDCNRGDYFRGYGFQLRQRLLNEYFVKNYVLYKLKEPSHKVTNQQSHYPA